MSSAMPTSFMNLIRDRKGNLIIIAIFLFFSFFYLSINHNYLYLGISSFTQRINSSTPRYAYATFLSSHPSEESEIEKDPYVIATRVLAYQLLHNPLTKTQTNIPLIVITPPHVPKSIQDFLKKEGVKVIQVDNLEPQSWKSSPYNSRWIDQFTKLRIFQLTEYDRILYMDNDMLITKCLDSIFDEKEVIQEQITKNKSNQIHSDEVEMPFRYYIGGAADQEGAEGERPKKIHSHSSLSGGFFIFKPDLHLFNYYLSILEQGNKGRFDKGMMEMGLLNYAHRRNGNMPWIPLIPGKWNANWPSWRDYERGSATLHDKFWDPSNVNWIDRRLVEMWWRVQGQMEGFWQARRERKLQW